MKKIRLHELIASPILPLLIAALARIIYWMQVHDQAWFQTPGMDPELYQEWAASILAGKGGEWLPFPRGPLYSYTLAGIWALFGDGWLAPRLFNLGCDLTTTWAVWWIAYRISGWKAGLAAGALFALVGAGIYYSGELLMTSLETCLTALFVVTLTAHLSSKRLSFAALAGLSVGLLALCRPNALPLLILTPVVVLWIRRQERPRKQVNISVVTLFLAALIAIAPVIYSNYRASGVFIPIATQGGVNVLIGNARSADGWSSILPGVGADWTDADAKLIAEQDAGKALSPQQVSNQLWRIGLREISADLPAWLWLEVKKLFLLLNVREIGNNRPLILPTEASSLHKVLFYLSLGSLIPLAFAGLAGLRGKKDVWAPILLTLLVMGGSLSLFFINTRYRAPLVPLVAALAGVGVVTLIEKLKQPFVWRGYLPLLIGVGLCIPPWVGSNFDNPAQGFFVAGNALVKQGRTEEAVEYYRRAFLITPSYPKLNLNWGAALLKRNDLDGARDCFLRELEYYPGSAVAYNNLGAVAERREDFATAEQYYRVALEKQPSNSDAQINLSQLLVNRGDQFAMTGDLMRSEMYYRQVEAISSSDPRPLTRLAALFASRGDIPSALAALDTVLTFSPGYDPAVQLRLSLLRSR